jgi:hypothetical protein
VRIVPTRRVESRWNIECYERCTASALRSHCFQLCRDLAAWCTTRAGAKHAIDDDLFAAVYVGQLP